MSGGNAEPLERQCSCGAPLTVETRESFRVKRSIALCQDPDCGLISAATEDGSAPENALRAFLVGDTQPVRYLRPHTRLFMRTIAQGFSWTAHAEDCYSCGHELTTQLNLPQLPGRYGDPHHVGLCLGCAATTISFFINGESIVLSLGASAWEQPATAIQALKRTLDERTRQPSDQGPCFS